MASGVSIRHFPLPASPDDRDFRSTVTMINDRYTEVFGNNDTFASFEEVWPQWQAHPETRRVPLIAELDGEPVGHAVLHLPTAQGPVTYTPVTYTSSAYVRPAYRRQRIGSALLDECDRIASENGRTVAQASSMAAAPGPGGRQLVPATGTGAVDADEPATRMLLARGYSLEQVEYCSSVDLKRDEIPDIACPAVEYRVVGWVGRTPGHYIDDVAALWTLLENDVPRGGMEATTTTWDRDHVRRWDERVNTEYTTGVVSAAEHVPSGKLVALTTVGVINRSEALSSQNITGVHTDHRGHGLGLAIKAHNLRLCASVSPTTRVYTWNAAENTHMRDINRRLGCQVVAVSGEWERRSRT